MPRKPDASLEAAILDSALQLLDQAGTDAVTMREVARLARTTTPTLYGRFHDREALLWALVARVQADMYRCVADAPSLEQISEILIRYFADFPGRMDLMNHYWPKLMHSDRPKPVLELARKKMREEKKDAVTIGDERAFALMALVLGTAMLMKTAGKNSPASKIVKQSSLKAVQVICDRM